MSLTVAAIAGTIFGVVAIGLTAGAAYLLYNFVTKSAEVAKYSALSAISLIPFILFSGGIAYGLAKSAGLVP